MKRLLASITIARTDVLALILTACACALVWPLHQLILLVVGAVYLFRGWLWICRNHPLLGWFLFGFARGLFGGGYYRRW
jgi:hypothetical protein